MAIDWARIKAEYVSGGISYAKLAKKHGVSVSSVKQKGTKEGWKKECTKVAEKVYQKAVQKTVQRRAENVAKEIACGEEVKAFFTETMRRSDIDIKDRLKAGEAMAKLLGLYTVKQDDGSQIEQVKVIMQRLDSEAEADE